jgi:hypothetical protein
MTYQIQGLDPAPFLPLANWTDEQLLGSGMQRIAVTADPGFPCRIRLDDAAIGDTVILLNHRSVLGGPFAASHAIFVTEGAAERAVSYDRVPPALDRRPLSLRAFDKDHMMVDAELVQPGACDPALRRLFERDDVAYIHAHNAIRGCFAAEVRRTG